MRKTILTCDRCKVEVEKLRPIYVEIERPNPYSLQTPKGEWCESCLIEVGIVRWKRKEVKSPDPQPSLGEQLEEIIRAMVAEEIPLA